MRRHAAVAGWLAGGLSVVLAGATLVGAQAQTDPLQGRVLQRSDGVLYVYRDGARYWLLPATLSDDEINVIPEAGPAVERLDDFFVPPTPTPPPPTPTPAVRAGDVLYQADWSQGMNGWTGTSGWSTANGMLVHGTGDGTAWAPFQAPSSDYAVEAELQRVASATAWAIAIRGNPSGQPVTYYGGGWQTRKAAISNGNPWYGSDIVEKEFTPGSDWHRYRVEAQGNHLRLFIDGSLIVETDDNRHLNDRGVGVFSSGQINVRNFKVIAL